MSEQAIAPRGPQCKCCGEEIVFSTDTVDCYLCTPTSDFCPGCGDTGELEQETGHCACSAGDCPNCGED